MTEATATPEFENGLMRVGHSSVIHLINPVPNGIMPFCKPDTTTGTIHPTDATEATCKRCIAKRDGKRP